MYWPKYWFVTTRRYPPWHRKTISMAETMVDERTQPRHVPHLEKIVAGVIIFVLPVTMLAPGGYTSINAGVLLALVISPVLLSASISRYRGTVLILALTCLALIAAPVLVSLATGEMGGRTADPGLTLRTTAFLVRSAVLLCAVLWARQHLSIRTLAALYAIGGLGQGLASPATWQGNAWKFTLAWPAAVLLLAMVHRSRRPVVVMTLTALALTSALFDSRSFLGFCVVAAILCTLPARDPSESVRGFIKLKWIALLGITTYALYRIGTYIALNGAFGDAIKTRTERQASNGGGSVLLGARSEWRAAVELFQSRPIGFGPGVAPTSADIQLGKSALGPTSSSSTYVDTYLFSSHIELHSVASDLWANFGLVGLALALVITWHLLQGLANQLSSRANKSGLCIIVLLAALWDMSFSPISALSTIMFALALTLPEKQWRYRVQSSV
jgi:hypothetical protein